MFLANMSHEIRTPLNGILGFAQLLAHQQGDISDPETQDFIATIQSSGKHLLNLINDILDISKVEAGRLEFEWGEFPVLPIFDEVLAVLRPRAEAKSIALRFCWIGPVPAQIHTDPRRLKQVLLNLIGNAVKFTDEGSVSVESRLERRGVDWHMVVDIVDTGIGIAANQLERFSSRSARPIRRTRECTKERDWDCRSARSWPKCWAARFRSRAHLAKERPSRFRSILVRSKASSGSTPRCCLRPRNRFSRMRRCWRQLYKKDLSGVYEPWRVTICNESPLCSCCLRRDAGARRHCPLR